MTADPIDRMIEILDGFDVLGDDLGAVSLGHRPCHDTIDGPEEGGLGAYVKAAIMHAGECSYPPPALALPAERKPCGDVHDGPCEVLDREETGEGTWLTVRHQGGEGRVFLGEIG